MSETKEGLKRLIWYADWTYQKFGIFKKYPPINFKTFLKWQNFNHSCWIIYFKIRKAKFNRIGYL